MAGADRGRDPAPTDDEALFVVRAGYSNNPVWLALALGRSAVLGQLLALVITLLLGPLVSALLRHHDAAEAIVVGCVFAIFGVFMIWNFARIDRGTFEFRRDVINIDWRPVRGPALLCVVPYSELSHIGLLSPTQVQLRFGIPDSETTHELVMPIQAHVGEDLFDHLVEFLEAADLDQVISIYEAGEVRYSKPWSFAELLPDAPQVTTAWVDKRSGGRPDTLRVGDRGFTLLRHRDHVHVLLDRGATNELVATMRNGQVLGPRGQVLVTMTSLDRDLIAIHSGTGTDLECRRDESGAMLKSVGDGAVVARAIRAGSRIEVTFAEPVHELWAAVLVMITARFYGLAVKGRKHPLHTTGYWVRPGAMD
jgi:hypothetical protein